AESQADPNANNNFVRSMTESCPGCFKYKGFAGDESPFADLAHAAGQLLADKDSDALLLSLMDLVQNHEQVVARLVGAALTLRQIAHDHDVKAQSGTEPFAQMPYETPVYDEIAQVISTMTSQHPGLVSRLIGSLADDAVVTPFGGVSHEGETMAN